MGTGHKLYTNNQKAFNVIRVIWAIGQNQYLLTNPPVDLVIRSLRLHKWLRFQYCDLIMITKSTKLSKPLYMDLALYPLLNDLYLSLVTRMEVALILLKSFLANHHFILIKPSQLATVHIICSVAIKCWSVLHWYTNSVLMVTQYWQLSG